MQRTPMALGHRMIAPSGLDVRPQLEAGTVSSISNGRRHLRSSLYQRIRSACSHRLTFETCGAVLRNNSNRGAGYIERNGQQQLIRVPGQARTMQDLAAIVVAERSGIPIRVSDVAQLGIGSELRTGAATQDGKEVVLGTVFMLIGENSRIVSKAVEARLQEVTRSLPDGVTTSVSTNRTTLVEKTLATVEKNSWRSAVVIVCCSCCRQCAGALLRRPSFRSRC